MADLFFQDKLAETNGEEDANGGENEIQQVGILELDPQQEVAYGMCQGLDDHGGRTCKETCGDADQQKELLIG